MAHMDDKPDSQAPCARCPKPIMRGQRYLRTDDDRLIHWTCGTPTEQGDEGGSSGWPSSVIPRSNEDHQPEKPAGELVRGQEV